jgi:protoporphyrin/coproporphyrin ferrochelatase
MSAVPLEDTPSPKQDEGPGLRVMTSRRVAIILFNLGGPDKQEAVRPFLFNLFNDKAIIGLPQPLRFFIAQLISRSRETLAKANYRLMGGGSPILPETMKQSDALEAAVTRRVSNVTFKCFAAMRYWKPFVRDAAKAAEAWGATDAILLPLYPQFSSTTTASSLKAWREVSRLPASTICCYPAGAQFAQAHADADLDRRACFSLRTGCRKASSRAAIHISGKSSRASPRFANYCPPIGTSASVTNRALGQ